MTGGVIPSKANHCLSGSERFAETDVVIALGDVLPGIPTENLRPGLHDDDRELRFRGDDISTHPAQGTASIPLLHIVAECPDVFQPEFAPSHTTMIRVPLSKLRRAASIQQSSKSAHATPAIATVVRTEPSEILSSIVFDEFIQLSLAVLLKRCPREILVGIVPTVDQTVRISLPFGPIARQLPTGRVEVSSPRFVSALPAEFSRYFRPQEHVNVPLPLQEIFQNLPGHRSRVAERAPPPVSREADLAENPSDNKTSKPEEMAGRPFGEPSLEDAFAAANRDSHLLEPREQVEDRSEEPLTSETASFKLTDILSPIPQASAGLVSEQAGKLDSSSPPVMPVGGSPDALNCSPAGETAALHHVESHPIAVASLRREVASDDARQDSELLRSNATWPQSEPRQTIHESSETRGVSAISGFASSEAGNPETLPIVPPPITPRATPPPSVTTGLVEPERTRLVRTAHEATTAFREEAIRDVLSKLRDYTTISQDIVALPGVLACLFFDGEHVVQAGNIPGDIEPLKLPELSNKVMESLNDSGFAIRNVVQQFTFHREPIAFTLFIPGALSLCAIFHTRDLSPFVREKIAAASEKMNS